MVLWWNGPLVEAGFAFSVVSVFAAVILHALVCMAFIVNGAPFVLNYKMFYLFYIHNFYYIFRYILSLDM